MKKKIKWILLGLLAVICAVSAYFLMTAPMRLELTEIQPQTASLTFVQQGSYTYERTYTLYPLLSGEVLEVALEEGDVVAPGDVIATLSATDYESQVAQLESTIRGYNAQIANLIEQEEALRADLAGTRGTLEGQLVTLEAQMAMRDFGEEARTEQILLQRDIARRDRDLEDLARETVDVLESLLDDGESGVTYADYLAAEMALANARRAHDASQQQLELLYAGEEPPGLLDGQRQSIAAQIAAIDARLSRSYSTSMAQYYSTLIEGTQASIDQLQSQMGRASITTPVGGVISKLYITDSNAASQQAPVAEIGIGETVEAFVPVREIDGIRPGDLVELRLDKRSGEEVIPGIVTFVGSSAQIRLSALGVEERRVRVLIQPQQPGLQNGYDMDVHFTLLRQEDSLVAPKTAVFTDSGTDYVWAVRDGVLVRQAVEKGVELRDGFIIQTGLFAGDRLVTDANNASLSEGKRVA